ncbi:SDR family NAD(P)-dependent oxidoreductase [Aromatoleum diolicum]|uniref:SDR family oxidoreductase n=1 Tax=Aromatoleum diolicum TaxID=75796 RepID=A0ABX1QB40_9RHOO|nr:SDR family oxidoreductase [Aromatoleum diolicum]NMG74597.1 SDR family oxidoreductase [Aromatoleum diolicum]
MDLGLRDTVVLITGGSKGIGLACARAFAAEGARVALSSRSADNLERAAATLGSEGFEAFTVVADLRDPQQAATMVQAVEARLGPIGVLVNSAGAAQRTPPAELTAAHWHAAMDAKYFTYVHAMDAVLRGMADRGEGVIINVIGMGGKLAAPTHLPGGAANAALMLASAGLANAFARKGIRVNAVNPGLTATDRMQQGLEAEARLAGRSADEVLDERVRAMPLGRLAQPGDVADTVVFLASKRASYVSGAVVSIDGAATPMVV